MKRTLQALLAAAILAIAAPASAQFYAYGAASWVKAEATTPTPVDDSNVKGFQMGAGWMFTPHFGAEIGYLNTGSHGSGATWKAEGFGIAAVGLLPLSDRWALIGKLGAYNLKGTFNTATMSVEHNLDGLPYFAGGIDWRATEALHIQGLVQVFNGKDELEKLHLVTVAAVLRF